MDARQEPAAQPGSSQAHEVLRQKVAELSTVSKDVERLTRQLSGATNISQVGMLKERIDSLSGTQRRLVMDIVELCAAVPDLQQKFLQLDRQLESVRQQVNDASQMDELERLRAQIDPLVSEWAESFQELVMRTLQGAPG